MEREPKEFTNFDNYGNGWGNDDQVWEEWAEKLGNWGELDLGEEPETENNTPTDNAL